MVLNLSDPWTNCFKKLSYGPLCYADTSCTTGRNWLCSKSCNFQEGFIKDLWNSLWTTRNSRWSTLTTLRITGSDPALDKSCVAGMRKFSRVEKNDFIKNVACPCSGRVSNSRRFAAFSKTSSTIDDGAHTQHPSLPSDKWTPCDRSSNVRSMPFDSIATNLIPVSRRSQLQQYHS